MALVGGFVDSTVPVCIAVSSYAGRRKLPFLVTARNSVVAAMEAQRIVSRIVSNHRDITVAVAVNAAAGNGAVVVVFVETNSVVNGVFFPLVFVLGSIRILSIVVGVVLDVCSHRRQ